MLKTPSFKWTAIDMYEEFQLFCKSLDSLFNLHGVPAEPGDDVCQAKVCPELSQLASHRKFNQGRPTSDSEVAHRAEKKSTTKFLGNLASTMDHVVPKQCQIYQLEDVHTQAHKSQDALINCLYGLANHHNFQPEREKGMRCLAQVCSSTE